MSVVDRILASRCPHIRLPTRAASQTASTSSGAVMDTACFSSEQIEVCLIACCALFVVDVAAAASAAA